MALFQPYLDKFWQGELQVDPVATVKHYSGPVLIPQRAEDIHVFATEDTPLLDAALKSRTLDDLMIVIVPSASHNMKFVQDPAIKGVSHRARKTYVNLSCSPETTSIAMYQILAALETGDECLFL